MKTKLIIFLASFQLIILLALIYSLFFKEESIQITEDLKTCERLFISGLEIEEPDYKLKMLRNYCSVEHSRISFNAEFTFHFTQRDYRNEYADSKDEVEISPVISEFKKIVKSDWCSKKDFLSFFDAVTYVNFNFTHYFKPKHQFNIKFSKKDCEKILKN